MSEQPDLSRSPLTRSQIEELTECAHRSSEVSLTQLLHDAQQHLELTRRTHANNRIVNLRMVLAIVKVIEQIVEEWNSLDTNARKWLAAAIQYFSDSNDDEPDFKSPIGFEDDVEVLNACLRFAKLDHLCINVEDYDDA